MKNLTLTFLILCGLYSNIIAQNTQDTAFVRREIDSLLTLAETARKAGNLLEAHDLAAVVKEKCERSIGKMTAQYALSLHVMANYFTSLLQMEKSVPLNLQALEIRRQVLGSHNLEYAKSLNNLVVNYTDMKLPEKALPLALESLAIREQQLAPEHPDLLPALSNLGKTYTALKEYDKATVLLERALVIREKQVGSNHSSLISILNLLGNSYTLLGDGDKAVAFNERLCKLALETAIGSYPMFLGNLAKAYAVKGQFDKELSLQITIDSLLLATSGDADWRWMDRSLYKLQAYLHNGMVGPAVVSASKMLEVAQRELKNQAAWMPGDDLFLYVDRLGDAMHIYLSLAKDYATAYPDLAAGSFDYLLLSKSLGLEAKRFLEQGLIRKNPESSPYLDEWKELRRQLSQAYAVQRASREELTNLETRSDLLESKLIEAVGGFAELRQFPTWQDVQRSIGKDEAAIEFSRFSYFENGESCTNKIAYIALLLRPGDAAPTLVPLFFEKDLLPLLPPDSLRDEQTLHDLYFGKTTHNGKSLADLAWLPLAPFLTGVKTLHFSPDGLFHRLNLAALAPDGKTPLAEHFQFHQLLTTRSLVKPQASIAPTDVLLLGGIRYDADSTQLQASLADLVKETGRAFDGNTSDNRGSETRGKGAWRYLRGSEKEVNDIEATMRQCDFSNIEKRMGMQARHSHFRSLTFRIAFLFGFLYSMKKNCNYFNSTVKTYQTDGFEKLIF